MAKTQKVAATAKPAPTVKKGATAKPITPPAERVHAPITKADYPAPGDTLELVTEAPKGLGADQRKRWEYCVAVRDACKTGKLPFTAEYLAKHAPDGRRTLRRAVRAGLFANWEYRKGGQK